MIVGGSCICGGEAAAKIRSPRLQPGDSESCPNIPSPLQRATEQAWPDISLSPAEAGSDNWEHFQNPRLKPGATGLTPAFAGGDGGGVALDFQRRPINIQPTTRREAAP
jgi:hypothetical protein